MKYIRDRNFNTFIAFVSSILCLTTQARLTVPKKSMLHNFVRCTRRYSPGMCIEPLGSVWTFVFQMQNCTERYGCPTEWRSNRFASYNRCIRRCKPLVDLYTEILAHDPQNLSAYLRSKSWFSGRRENDMEDLDYPEIEENEDQHLVHSVEGPAPNILEDDSDHTSKDLIPDIDYIDGYNA